MRSTLESGTERVTWGQVAVVGTLAVAGLLGLAAWAGEAVTNYASCVPPLHHMKPGRVYTCPAAHFHTWTVHPHAALVRGLLAGAVIVAVLAGVAALTLARRRRSPAVGTV